MHKSRLEEIQKRANQTLMIPSAESTAWIRQTREDLFALVGEVERLQGRLKDVRNVVEECSPLGEDVPAQRILEAVDGHRAASLEELRGKILGGISDTALTKWINDGKARVSSDGKLIIDDVSGLAMEVLQGQYGSPTL